MELTDDWEWHANDDEVNHTVDRLGDEKSILQAVAFPFDQGVPSSANGDTSPNAQ